MHQPCYREPDSRVFRLPWVRLHALKDYGDMPALALAYPELKLTFNLVPGLLDQLEDYAAGRATDKHLELSQKNPQDLSPEEKNFILQEFFMANWERMIKPHPRYWELLQKRGLYFHPDELPKIARRFDHQDIVDLQVWFNLAWTDPGYRQQDDLIASLVKKSRQFTLGEKEELLQRQQAILGEVIPLYRRALSLGNIEISTSPFHHPILPLLCDSDIARECQPEDSLPRRFCYPQDAEAQIESALEYMESRFGQKPKGLWPSEGSLSEAVLALIRKQSLVWTASDEGILEKSLGISLRKHLTAGDPKILYKPYYLDGQGPAIFFRDRVLSDLIGFSYSSWEPDLAAADMIKRLEAIADQLGSEAERHLVSIILDGENAWEYYPDDGNPFLSALYQGLVQNSRLQTCTFSEFLSKDHAQGSLERLYPGSWINSDFGIWIGRKEDNQAWELLTSARDLLESRRHLLDGERLRKVAQEVAIAEGSDWCWWYGGQFDSEHLSEFDRLYRSHIIQIYRLLGEAPPEAALAPITTIKPAERYLSQPSSLITPCLDGRSTDFYEWTGAGRLDTKISGGTMHRSQSLIKEIFFGCDLENIYLRIDPVDSFSPQDYPDLNIVVEIIKPQHLTIPLFVFQENQPEGRGRICYQKIIEIAIPIAILNSREPKHLFFYIRIRSDSIELERHPNIEPIKLELPDQEYLLRNWQI